MEDFIVPDVDDAVMEAIRKRAALSGRTVDDEARTILLAALAEKPKRQRPRRHK